MEESNVFRIPKCTGLIQKGLFSPLECIHIRRRKRRITLLLRELNISEDKSWSNADHLVPDENKILSISRPDIPGKINLQGLDANGRRRDREPFSEKMKAGQIIIMTLPLNFEKSQGREPTQIKWGSMQRMLQVIRVTRVDYWESDEYT